MHRFSFETLNERAAQQLRDAADRVRQSRAPTVRSWQFDFGYFRDGQIDQLIDEISTELPEKCRSLYTFTVMEGDPTRVRSAFQSARADKLDSRAYARSNDAEVGKETLYVGSSRNTASRLRQHFGFGPVRTYALHMSAWSAELEGKVQIDVYQYGDETTDEMLLALEDQLWSELRPVFGKRGSK